MLPRHHDRIILIFFYVNQRISGHSRLQWNDQNMMDAMRNVKDHGMTIRGAAKKYNVPYSTLKDRIKGRVKHGVKPGVKTVLRPEEEEELVKFIQVSWFVFI